MREFDEQEKKIVCELIRNPKISDNQIGKRTGISVKTVNRKRKNLEKENIIRYYTEVNHSGDGTGQLTARQMFVIELRHGITRKEFLEKIEKLTSKKVSLKHVFLSILGEKNGHLVLAMVLESYKQEDLLEIFNADITVGLKNIFGDNAIYKTTDFTLMGTIRFLHSYIPMVNMDNGRIKEDWPKEKIFVD